MCRRACSRFANRPFRLTRPFCADVEDRTQILGYNFSAPIFISPAAAPGLVGGYVPPERELGLVQGAGSEEVLYIPALYAEMSIEEMAEAQLPEQVMFQQVSGPHHRSRSAESADIR